MPIVLKTPYINNLPRQVKAAEVVGNMVIVGGDFLQIQLRNGTVVDQPYLAAFDLNNGSFIESFRPRVDNEVVAIEHGPTDSQVIIGGRFVSITDTNGNKTFRHRLALLNLPNGTVDQAWEANADSKVTTIDLYGDRLFVGGDFTNIDGQPIAKLAEIKMSNSTVNPAFSFTWGGTLARRVLSALVTPDGSRLVVGHRATSINGNAMRGTAVFDISDQAAPTLTPHRMATNTIAYAYYNDIQDAEMSPDGQYIALVQGTATASDYVHLIPTTEAPNQFKWRHFMRDSAFGVAVSDTAVYVGGHFCKPDGGPGPTEVMAPKGLDTCTGVFYAGGAWRTQLAALSLDDGTPLAWNPGNDAYRGASFLKATSRGLLVGYDGERTNYYRVGAFAFFDFGGPFVPPPNPTTITCSATVNANNQVSLSWNNVGVASYQVLRGNTTLGTVQGTTYNDSPGAGSFTYVIRATVNGQQVNGTCSPNPVVVNAPPPAALTCTAVVGANNQVTLTWNNVGVADYAVRDGNTWLSTVQGLTYTINNPTVGNHSYNIRTRPGGVITDTPCTPNPVVITAAPPALTCTAVVGANNAVTLTWNNTGAQEYTVRINDVWVTTVQGTTYTETPAPGSYSYVIRAFTNNVQVGEGTCTPNPVVITAVPPPNGALTCTVAKNAAGQVVVNWTQNVSEYYAVRLDGNWLATTDNQTFTYTHLNPTPGNHVYQVRYKQNGVKTDIDCTPNPIAV
jgi:azurin